MAAPFHQEADRTRDNYLPFVPIRFESSYYARRDVAKTTNSA